MGLKTMRNREKKKRTINSEARIWDPARQEGQEGHETVITCKNGPIT